MRADCYYIAGLSSALLTSGAMQAAQANNRLTDDDVSSQLPTTEQEGASAAISQKTEWQITFFAGLFILFLVMVALLFLRHRNKNKKLKRPRPKQKLSEGLWRGDNSSFTPNMFSSESSPAILVAEHDNDLRLFITNTLRLNYRVISTSDGEEAFEKAFELVPDLIIINRFMPGLDGPVLCKKLKTSEVTSHIPVIILTPNELNGSLEDWHHYADDHLHKSFDARELLMRVHKLIIHRKNLQKEYRKHIKREDESAAFALPEQAFLQKLKRVLRTYHSDPMFGVEQLTDQLHMTRLQLYRKLKALTTHSPGDCIRSYRIEQAKNILSHEGIDLNEVATRAGFTNISAFTKAFKEHTGIAPGEFAILNATNDSSVVEE